MAFKFDPFLNKGRLQDITPAEIKQIYRAIDESAGEAIQEIENVATVAALNSVTNPSTEKIYVVEENNSIYRYDGSTFQSITGTILDNTLYTNNINSIQNVSVAPGSVMTVIVTTEKPISYDLEFTGRHSTSDGWGTAQHKTFCKYYGANLTFDEFVLLMATTAQGDPITLYRVEEPDYNMLLGCGNVMTVIETYPASTKLEAYTLTVANNGNKILVGKEGYAELVGSIWVWTRYAKEGHKHDASDIIGLKQNVMVGTEAERLAFTPYEGLEWHEIETDLESGHKKVTRFLYENEMWRIIEAPEISTSETVYLHIGTFDGQGNLENLEIGVTDNVTHEAATYHLDENGNCQFSIPKGHTYKVIVASLTDYHDLPDQTFTAQQDNKSINMVFLAAGTQYEKVSVHITAYNANMANTKALQDEFIGQTITCNITNGNPMSAEVDSTHNAVFMIPYGKEYTIQVPYLAGFIAIYGQTFTHTASISERTCPAHYLVWTGSDIMGMDANGGLHDYAELQELGEETARALIKGLYINNSTLQAQNASFAYKLPLSTVSKSWCASNVEFDTDLLPFKTSHATAVVCMNGPINTQNIIAIGDSLGKETAAADWCVAQTMTVGDVTINGYLGEYGEMYQLAANLAQLTAFHLLLGYAAPTFNIGHWWTSTQSSATNAVILGNGGFGTSNKNTSDAVIALFRPFGN